MRPPLLRVRTALFVLLACAAAALPLAPLQTAVRAPAIAPLQTVNLTPAPPSMGKTRKCLPNFSPSNQDFDKCKNHTCFIFLREEPYIRLDASMKYDNQSVLFECKTPNAKFPHLGGTAFKVIQRTSARDSLCVWGGPECLFNNMVDFIDEVAQYSQHKYQFAATGLLLENSKRVRKHIIPSVSLIKEELVIFGVDPVASKRRHPFPLYRIVRPFTYGTWGLFVAFSWLIAIGAALTAAAFGPRPFNAKGVSQFYIHDYPATAVAETTLPPSAEESVDSTVEEVELLFSKRVMKRLATYKMAKRLIKIAVSAMVVIFLLFYELAVVHFLFIEQKKPVLKDVRTLSARALEEYSVEENAATEDVWNRTVYAPGKYTKDTIPWFRCKTNSLCFDAALDPNNKVKYVVGFKSAGTYQVLHRSTCSNMTLYRTENELYKFGAGWLYGSGVDENFRRNVDRDILNVDLSEELHTIAEKDAGSLDTPDCRTEIRDIDVGIIGACVLILTVPSLLLLIFIVIYYCVKRIPQAIDENEHMHELEPTTSGKKKKVRRRRVSTQEAVAVHV